MGEERLVSKGMSIEAMERHREEMGVRARMEAGRVERRVVGGWGTVKRFKTGEGGGEVVWLETRTGGHDDVGGTEGVISLIGSLWPRA